VRRWNAAAVLLILALTATAAACSGDDGGSPDTTPTTAPPTEGANGVLTEVAARLSHQITIAGVVEVDADRPVRVEVTATAGDDVVEVPRTARARRDHQIPVVGLHAETTYTLDVQAFDETGEQVDEATTQLATGALPDWVPPITLNSNDVDAMAPGVTLFDIQRWGITNPPGEPPGMLVAVDEQGEVVWYLGNDLGAGDSRMDQDGNIWFLFAPFGFKEVDLLGRRIQSWAWGGPEDVRPGGPTIVDSDQYDLVSFHHEVAPQPDGDIVAFSRYEMDLTDAEQEAICPGDPADFGIREDVVMEFTRDGRILHEWPLHEILDPAEVPGRELCSVDYEDHRDWAHGNGIVLDEAGNQVIVTARHIDLLFAFRYEDDADGPSGELLWSIGPDGTLPLDGEPSYGLHAPELEPDGSILVFDNGNERPGDVPYSRAVRYVVDDSSDDPADWTARQTWEFRTDDLETGDPLYADFLGDADQLPNGNVLVGFGGIGQVELPARGRMIEVVPTGSEGGDIVWDVSLPDTYTSYRAERLASLYAGPRWMTDVVVPIVS
jgi:hypothetical protein